MFANFFVGRGAGSVEGEVAGSADIALLRQEIAATRADIERSRSRETATGARTVPS